MHEFDALAERLRQLALSDVGAIDHVGSTSVPGLAAKDVIDVQVRLPELDARRVTPLFERFGFRRRPEPWNNVEATRRGAIPKLVFAPAPGSRRCNIHVRVDGTAGACDTLLFRDFLRATTDVRDAWGLFKRTILDVVPDAGLDAYGQLKQPAWLVLMYAADAWAEMTGWLPAPLGPWPTV